MTEDSLEYAEDCSQIVKKVILLNQPWNQDNEESGKIIRVRNWSEIQKILS